MSNKDVNEADSLIGGHVVLGDALYLSYYLARDGEVVQPTLKRIGGGWSTFKALEVSDYGPPDRATAYGLRGDGVLFRWSITNGVWRAKTSYPGFAAVKAMTLISQTSTYDTFLANTRGGGLYTIHIPTTAHGSGRILSRIGKESSPSSARPGWRCDLVRKVRTARRPVYGSRAQSRPRTTSGAGYGFLMNRAGSPAALAVEASQASRPSWSRRSSSSRHRWRSITMRSRWESLFACRNSW